MTNSETSVLTGDHMAKHPTQRVAEVRAANDATIPDGYEPLGYTALASRLTVSTRTARRRLETLAAQQRHPDVLRVVRLPVAIGSGAKRLALHVLWPKPRAA